MTRNNFVTFVISMILWACIAVTVGAFIAKGTNLPYAIWAIIGAACIGGSFGAWFAKNNY